MKKYNEMEIYNSGLESEASKEDVKFYKKELNKIRKENSGIIICWIEPDEEYGHIEFKCFKTWTDAEIYTKQR